MNHIHQEGGGIIQTGAAGDQTAQQAGGDAIVADESRVKTVGETESAPPPSKLLNVAKVLCVVAAVGVVVVGALGILPWQAAAPVAVAFLGARVLASRAS